MTTALRVCGEPGCPTLGVGRYCVPHARVSSRNHRGVPRQLRGHGATYERARAALAGLPCALGLPGCTGTADSADYSVPGDWSSPLQPACRHCQSVQGALLSHAAVLA